MPGTARLRISGWTLRSRLTASLVVLLAVVSLAIAGASVLALQRFTVDQLDRQLVQAVQRSQNFVPDGDDDGGSRPPSDLAQRRVPPGTPPGGLYATVQGGAVSYAVTLDQDGRTSPLGSTDQTLLTRVPADGAVHTLHLGGALGEYRAVADRTPSGLVKVTGLPLAGAKETVASLLTVLLAVSLLGLVVCALLGAAIVSHALRPMRRLVATARRVTELPLDRGDVPLAVRVPEQDADPRTEVGQVGAALNRMLGHVSAAFEVRAASEDRMRRFVSDASHELRTPLASIRGYAELTRRSDEEVPPMTANALRRVEAEAVRMTGLVEDLLLLARLDEKRPLARTPVDLTDLVVDAVGDAHAASPEHLWRLALPDEPVVVTGDRDRLHQVVANLLANARVHTPAGTTVEVGLESGPDGSAVLRVTDDGPGIPAALVPEVFDRFARADTSRTRDERSASTNTSTGLGLAIVASVVQAHGGRVGVRSRPGCTEFSVLIPGADADPDPAQRDVGATDQDRPHGALVPSP